jgi:hypothetical protein
MIAAIIRFLPQPSCRPDHNFANVNLTKLGKGVDIA